MTISPKWAIALHTLGVGIVNGIGTFLIATFATGLPHTQAAWRAVALGCLAAAASRVIGWIVNMVNTSPPPGANP
jgi:hypothetical protein